MLPEPDRVTQIIKDVARDVVLPRFRTLASHEVSEKTAGELVTIADVESEQRLGPALSALIPGSLVVGEESYEDDNSVLAALGGNAPVWVVDPVDGTKNFVNGKDCFAMIIALCLKGETLAGWIHDPVAGRTAWTAAGQGSWLDGERLKVAAPAPVTASEGSAGDRIRRRLDARRDEDPGAELPRRLVRYRCVGQEYIDLAAGKLHFARYAGRLKPWDHAAGVLMHNEAGGYSRLPRSGAAYRPSDRILEEPLFLAPDRASWDALHTIVAPE